MEKTQIIAKFKALFVNKQSFTQTEEVAFVDVLHAVGFPKARVVCGLVYLEGEGEPDAISTVAKVIVKKMEGE